MWSKPVGSQCQPYQDAYLRTGIDDPFRVCWTPEDGLLIDTGDGKSTCGLYLYKYGGVEQASLGPSRSFGYLEQNIALDNHDVGSYAVPSLKAVRDTSTGELVSHGHTTMSNLSVIAIRMFWQLREPILT